MYIHEKLFDICNNNILLYRELIEKIKIDYQSSIKILIESKIEKNIIIPRQIAHRIIGTISYLDRTLELIYLCKTILLYDKTNTTYEIYKPHIEELTEYNIDYIIG